MKIACTGANGKVGQRLLKMGVLPLECDVTDLGAVERAIQETRPTVICHLAALSDVDFCEDPANKEKVIKTNLRGTWNVALAAASQHVGVALVSTDHVFNGKRGPYRETDVPKDPVNFYGMSKMAAESLRSSFDNMKIVRTSTLFNQDRVFNRIVEHAQKGIGLDYPTFLQRSFMFEGHFADNLHRYLRLFDSMPRILHISGRDTVSWYEFALAAASVFEVDKTCIQYRKREFKGNDLAPRPHKAGLQVRTSAKFLPQYNYIDGLKALREEMG